MLAGQLRHRIGIERKTETRDAYGGVIETWVPIATRWGHVVPLTARESFQAQQVDARISHHVRLRHFDGLTAEDRLTYAARVFHISAVLNPLERDQATDILAMEQT